MINRYDTSRQDQKNVEKFSGLNPFRPTTRGFNAKPAYPLFKQAKGTIVGNPSLRTAQKPQGNIQAFRHNMSVALHAQKKIRFSQIVSGERNQVHNDPSLTLKERQWLRGTLGRLSTINGKPDRDSLLAREKNMLASYAKNETLSPALRRHLGRIASKIYTQTSSQHIPAKHTVSAQPAKTNLQYSSPYMQNSARPHQTASSGVSGGQHAHRVNGQLNGLQKTPTLNPLAQQALESLRQRDTKTAMARINSVIGHGEVSKAVHEAITTGFDAASLGGDQLSNQKLNELDKPDLKKVMTLAKQRVDVRIATGELTPEAGKKANEDIDNILDKFTSPYNKNRNIKAVMNKLKASIADAKNARDAKNCLSKGLYEAQKTHGSKADIESALIEARLIALGMPNGNKVKDILLDFGQESGVHQQQAEKLLNKYAEGFGRSGQGVEHLSQQDLDMVIRLAKLNAPQGASKDYIVAALNAFAQQALVRK